MNAAPPTAERAPSREGYTNWHIEREQRRRVASPIRPRPEESPDAALDRILRRALSAPRSGTFGSQDLEREAELRCSDIN